MKRFILYISILFFGLAYVTKAQTAVSLPDTTVTVGTSSITLPLSVQGFNNVGAVSIKFSYNPAVLQFDGIENPAHASITANATSGEIAIGWFSPDGVTPINISNGNLLDLKFTYLGGTSQLNFIPAQSEVSTILGAALVVNYTNGQVSSPIRVSLDHVKASPGDTVRVPMRALNLLNVGAISLKIAYNPTVLEYIGIENDSVGYTLINAAGGMLSLGWFSTGTAFNMSDGVMGELIFRLSDNASGLEFFNIGSETEIADMDNNILDVTFVNGSVATERSVKLPTLEATPGTDVSFPLTVTNINVGSASLEILFDPAVLTFKEVANSAGDVALGNVISPGRLRIGYFDESPTFSTGDLFDIVFTYAGGGSDVSFDQAASSFTDSLGAIYSGFDFVDGAISALLNQAPVFTSEMPDTTIAEADTLAFQYTATDINGDTLVYSLSTAPIGAVIDSLTGVFSWIPGFDQAGTHNVIAVVSDGLLTDTSRTSIVVVSNTNQLPVFTAEMPDDSIQEGDTLSFMYAATDADGEPLKFGLTEAPAGAAIVDTTGEFTWIPSLTQQGTHNVVAFVTDGIDTVVSRTTIVVVSNLNQVPVFTATMPDQTVNEDDIVSFKYTATDADGDTVFFSLLAGSPAGATINQLTGDFFWQPTFTQAGVRRVYVGITDNKSEVVRDTAVVTVINVNRPPVFVDVLNNIAQMKTGDTLTFKFTATDADGQILRFFLNPAVPGAVLVSNNGNFRYIPTTAQNNVVFNVGVTDQEDTVYHTFTVATIIVGIEIVEGLPKEFTLKQNYPNPFNPSTSIKFSVPTESFVTLKIYNLLGEEVASLVNELLPAANYKYSFDASRLSSGIYIYRIEAGDFISTKKMTLMK